MSPSTATRAGAILRAELGPSGVKSLSFLPFDGNWGSPKPAGPAIAAQARAALDRLGAFEQRPDLLHFGADAPPIEGADARKVKYPP